MNTTDKCLAILEKTDDGNKLSPRHLKLIEMSVNQMVNETGLQELDRVYEMVISGNYCDWFHGIEGLTQDYNGYIYWKCSLIEHFSYRDYDEEKQAAQKLAEICRSLENAVIPVNRENVWNWENLINQN
ncbi:MAG TPA: hypothetical protein VK203_10840 [Nostocaceae cyanobacterium]|nr:hypothetical protein [Nostocaceae cyanobacterium]